MVLSTYLVGHRGYPSKYGDNTERSFEKAIHSGASMIETDIRLSSDGVWVLAHDPYYADHRHHVHRNSREVAKTVSTERPFGVLTLEQGLDVIDGRVPVYLDIKGHPTKDQLSELVDMLCKLCSAQKQKLFPSWRLEKFWLASFNHSIVKTLLKIRRRGFFHSPLPFHIGFIGPIQPVNWSRFAPRSANLRGIDFVATEKDLVTLKYIQQVQGKYGLKLFVYTLNTRSALHHFNDCGVDGLLTDHVHLFAGLQQVF